MRRILLFLAVALLCLPAFGQGVFISEYIEGSSNNKAIEIFNGTGAPLNMSNYQIRMYFNGSGTSTLNITLAGVVAPNDVYVLAHSSASGAIAAQADQFNGAGWFNGDDAVALYHVPSATIVDVVGQIGFDPGTEWGSGLTSTADNTLRRKTSVLTGDPNGSDPFDPSIEWDGFATDTFGGLGSHGIVIPPPVTVREVYEIQGSGAVSPFAGQIVETRDNIVTAVGHQGFFIQTPDYRADASSATSNGIYVFTSTAPAVQVGDQVDVKGTVTEFFDFTEFTNSGLTVTVDTSGQPIPAIVTLTPGNSTFEPLEGMLVRVSNGTAVDGTDQFSETMIVAASSRPFRTPGLGGDAHPEILDVDPTGLGGAAPSIVGGATIHYAEGPLAFDFGDYSIWTTAGNLQYTNPAYPRPVRARNASEFTVGGQNMFRLFDTVNDPAISDDVPTPAVYAARLAKISDHVRNNLGAPDVLAVSEVENMTALADLAAKINFDQAGLNYVPYLQEGNDVGGIDVGFLVRDTVYVDSIAQLGANDTWLDPDTNAQALLNDRPPLLLTGSYIGNGAPFPIAVIAVHQRSLIGVDTPRVQQKRQAQAENLAGYINALPSGTRLVVTGDFNAFQFDDGYVDVMGILTSTANLTNQVGLAAANERYSYVENGVAQVLDHSITSAAMNAWVRGLNFAHANADKPFEANPASDHDGVVLFLMSDHDGDGYADDADQCPAGDASATVVLNGCDSGAPNIAFAGGCTLADQINALHASAKNHGQFVSAVAKLLNDLMKSGQLTGAQKGAIQSCAAQWN
ncbi:MAG TPA: lamin tail domain-containing protein [Thermoanaerobaculia bacterium]|nr:lamin tail domain-containing protein [Thermoanaerobaculia bacterium]